MIRIAVLGDIGSGKSHVAKLFGFPVFNADAEVAKLYRKSRKCYNKLKKILPKYITSFPIKKVELSKAIMANKKNLKKIVKVVHPEIRSSMNNFLKKNKNRKFVILDIPLLMENKIFIKTFGCQMNEYDSNRIYHSVKKIGFEKTEDLESANCYILNTCHIRDKAKEKVYHEIGRIKKIYKQKNKPIMIVAGCVAQAENQEMLKREPYIDIVIGPQSYHKINEVLKKFIPNEQKEETEFDTISKFEYFDKIENKGNKISAFLTIQEGCDKFCYFCVVPFTRGPEYSRPLGKILCEADTLIKNGAKEITLLGQNVNAYSYFENSNFQNGTKQILEIISQKTKNDKIFSVAGGGETVAAINKFKKLDSFTFVSTAGGAFLEHLEGKTLPGIKALNQNV